MIVAQPFWSNILLICKYVGTLGVAGAVIYAVLRCLVRVIKKITSIDDNICLILGNHLPHLGAAIENQSKSLDGLKSDLRDVDTRVAGLGQGLEDPRATVTELNCSFIQHLNTSARELVEAKAASAKNELDIAAITAAKEVFSTASETAKNLIETTTKNKSN